MELSPVEFFLVAGFGFLILEIITGGLIFLGFSIGAFCTALLYFFFSQLEISTVIIFFTICSAISFVVLRNFFKKSNETKAIEDGDINQY